MSQDISAKDDEMAEKICSSEKTLGQTKNVSSAPENAISEHATWDNANTTWADSGATWTNIKTKI